MTSPLAFGQGSPVYIRMNDRESVVQVDGVVYDPNIQPPSFGGVANFYATRDYFGDLTGTRDFNRILAGVAQYDKAPATAIADQMQVKLEKQNIDSGGAAPPDGSRVSDPKKHFFQDVMDGIFFILGVMAILALILGLFLVYNTITAIISRQINQIGILKAIGAGTGQVLAIYLINVFIYGFLALMIALPLGALGARALGTFLLNAFNADFLLPCRPFRRHPFWLKWRLPCCRLCWLALFPSLPGRASPCARRSAPMGWAHAPGCWIACWPRFSSCRNWYR